MRRLAFALLLVIAVLAFRWAQEEGGNRAYRNGDYAKAAERYREAIGRGRKTAQLSYNLGTSLFRLSELESARSNLIESLEAQSPELRARAFYNLGNAFARPPVEGEASAEDLRTAIEAYRRSLLLDPNRDEVRWNFELTLRQLEELERESQALQDEQEEPEDQQQGDSGGEPQPREGGSGAMNPQAGDQPPELSDLGSANDPLSKELAEQILRAVEEHERSLQREKLRRQRRRVRGPDW